MVVWREEVGVRIGLEENMMRDEGERASKDDGGERLKR